MPYEIKGLNEECGVFGIYNVPDAANVTYFGLHALQHRGQQGAGIVASDDQKLRQFRQPVPERLSTDPIEGRTALQILPNGEILIQYGVLENHTQAAFDGIRILVQRGSIDTNGSGIFRQLPAKNVDGSGLPCSVDAQESKQLPLLDPEAQILYRMNLSESLV